MPHLEITTSLPTDLEVLKNRLRCIHFESIIDPDRLKVSFHSHSFLLGSGDFFHLKLRLYPRSEEKMDRLRTILECAAHQIVCDIRDAHLLASSEAPRKEVNIEVSRDQHASTHPGCSAKIAGRTQKQPWDMMALTPPLENPLGTLGTLGTTSGFSCALSIEVEELSPHYRLKHIS